MSGLLRVFVEDPRNGEAVESSIKDISMTDEEKEQARADVQHEISPDTEWDQMKWMITNEHFSNTPKGSVQGRHETCT